MMRLTLTPTRGLPGARETAMTVKGDTLTVDGTVFNLKDVPEGGVATPNGPHPFVGTIARSNGVIEATVAVILGDTALPDQPDSPWVVTAGDGPVTIPAARVIEEAR